MLASWASSLPRELALPLEFITHIHFMPKQELSIIVFPLMHSYLKQFKELAIADTVSSTRLFHHVIILC